MNGYGLKYQNLFMRLLQLKQIIQQLKQQCKLMQVIIETVDI